MSFILMDLQPKWEPVFLLPVMSLHPLLEIVPFAPLVDVNRKWEEWGEISWRKCAFAIIRAAAEMWRCIQGVIVSPNQNKNDCLIFPVLPESFWEWILIYDEWIMVFSWVFCSCILYKRVDLKDRMHAEKNLITINSCSISSRRRPNVRDSSGIAGSSCTVVRGEEYGINRRFILLRNRLLWPGEPRLWAWLCQRSRVLHLQV